MNLGTTYYWQIISEDSQGETATGPIWSFTTELEPNEPPTAPDIYGPPLAPPGVELTWAFVSNDPDGHQLKYIIDWGDGNTHETNYNSEGVPVEASHTYEQGKYTIKAKAEDEKGRESQESTFEVTIKKPKNLYHSLIQRWFERFSNLFPLLQLVLQRLGL
jgi:hypothetical protein